jgi:hypothetical protein
MESTSGAETIASAGPCSGPSSPQACVLKTSLAVFFGSLVVYHLNGKPHPEVDCVAAPYTTWSLVRHASLDLSAYPELRYLLGTQIIELADGRWLSIRPPGSALAALPFVAPLAAFREKPPGTGFMLHVGKLTGACFVSGAVVIFFLLCRRLVPEAAKGATVLFAFGTTLWSVSSQALWMHGPATFWLCSALYLVLTPHEGVQAKGAVAAGLAFGMAILTRPTTLFFGLAAGIVLLWQRRWRASLGLALGGLIPVTVLILLNLSYFGHPLYGGYAGDSNWDQTPLWLGACGLLVAPSRGMLVYSPALCLVPIGLWALGEQPSLRRRRALLAGFALAALATVLFYARWGDWRGGWCYGPRFLSETMPVWCLLFAVAYRSVQAAAFRRLAHGLIALSVFVQFLGIAGHRGYVSWHLRQDYHDQGRCLFSLRDTQIAAHLDALILKVTGRH